MINIVTALACEAKPLIHNFKLNGLNNKHPFRIYENDYCRLVISGVGKLNAAAATTYVATLNDEEIHSGWINIGIAGHAEFEVGCGIIAHKICDAGSKKSWFPAFANTPTTTTCALVTEDRPQNNYQPNAMCDMEASGFCAAAANFASMEFVHCLKIISDNINSPIGDISDKKVSLLLENQLPTIERFTHSLNQLAQEWQQINAAPNNYEQILSQCHFTVYQQNQLKQLLRRWQTLMPEEPAWPSTLTISKNAKLILTTLEHRLRQYQISFNGNLEKQLER